MLYNKWLNCLKIISSSRFDTLANLELQLQSLGGTILQARVV